MARQILFLFLLSFWLFSCAETASNSGGNSNNSGSNSNGNGVCSNEWGGVTCISGTSTYRGFTGFISDDTTSSPYEEGILTINCQPSNTRGVLFKANVVLNADFDVGGDNQDLVMQIHTSTLTITVFESIAEVYESGNSDPSFTYELEGLSGVVNGNEADLTFIRNDGTYGLKEVRLKGTFDADFFEGKITYENTKKKGGGSPASGTLGTFKISTCSVFGS